MSDAKFISEFATGLEKLKSTELASLRADVEALKGKSPKAYVIETWKNGDLYYRVWSDGLIEQRGLFSNLGQKVTFPMAFTKVPDHVCVGVKNWDYVGTFGATWISTKNVTATGFDFRGASSQTQVNENLVRWWYACGY